VLCLWCLPASASQPGRTFAVHGGRPPGERFPRRARCAGFFCGGAL